MKEFYTKKQKRYSTMLGFALALSVVILASPQTQALSLQDIVGRTGSSVKKTTSGLLQSDQKTSSEPQNEAAQQPVAQQPAASPQPPTVQVQPVPVVVPQNVTSPIQKTPDPVIQPRQAQTQGVRFSGGAAFLPDIQVETASTPPQASDAVVASQPVVAVTSSPSQTIPSSTKVMYSSRKLDSSDAKRLYIVAMIIGLVGMIMYAATHTTLPVTLYRRLYSLVS